MPEPKLVLTNKGKKTKKTVAETIWFLATDLPLANVAAFSIDDVTTTEIDDALSVERLDDGTVRVGIHIAAPALGIVRDQMQRLRTEPVSQEELEDAKIRLISAALLNEASASGQADEISEIAQYHLPRDYYGTLAQRYAAITPADVQRAAKQYLRPDRLIEVFAGPPGPWASQPL